MSTSPVRPERPAFICLDPDSDDFDDSSSQHIAFYPAEREEACIVSVTELVPPPTPPSGIISRNPYRTSFDAPDIPPSVRSFSLYPSTANNQQGNVSADVTIAGGLNNSRDSSPSPSNTSTQWLNRSRSRSPLAGPPSYPVSPTETVIGSPDPMKHPFPSKLSRRSRFKSTALLDLDTNPLYKPWIGKKDALSYVSYWLTWSMILFMASASALGLLVSMSKIQKVGNLCLVLDDDFEKGLDRSTWFHEVDMGGFGNGEFEMMTNSENNSFVEDGILYLVPTLTSDVIGKQAILDGYTYNISGCTNANLTKCGAISNSTLKHVINPVQSARITTKYSHSIRYGKVEVRARLPRGDWLWPAIWMLPLNNEYGPWPVSGEIDIMESRGNDIKYPFQGRNFVRTSLNWGPVDFLNSVAKTFGWFTKRRQDFSDDYHTYVLEWSDKFMHSYVDNPINSIFDIKFDRPFFELGDYPPTAQNGSEQVAITNPWAKSDTNSAPFDKPFYLIMNVAVGGRNGWFPDTLGGKMWFDSSDDAMYDFAKAQEVWYKTWPDDLKRRGMAIDYVKIGDFCHNYTRTYGDESLNAQYGESYPMAATYSSEYNPGPSGPYAQPSVQQNSGYGGGYGDVKNPYEGERFKPKKRIKDPIFLLLFIAQLVGYCIVSAIVLRAWIKDGGLGGGLGGGSSGTSTGSSVTLNQHTVYLLLLVTAAALLLSCTQLLVTRLFTRMIMHVTLILSILLNIGICIYYWITKYYSGAIIFTIIAILSIVSYWGFRSRIPLASLLLQIIMDVSKHHKSVFVVAFISLIIQAALSVWFSFVAIATYAKYTPGNPSCSTGTSCSSGKVAGLIFFEAFCYLWTSQVVGNVALATLAGGPYGAWYYFGPREMGQMPKHPTLSAFARASTFSLGSIAFGSLIVTLLELLRTILQIARNSASQDGSPIEVILFCCAECFIGCIEGLVQYFNRYAYIEIALYGKSYIEAAKDTWTLFKDRGIDALVNDSLVGMTLTWGAYVVGLLASLFAYLYLRFTHPAYNADGQYTAPVLLFAFLIGVQCSLTMSSAIEAGVSTIFVGLGENPEVLAMRAPALFEMIRQTYPNVVMSVHGP